MRVVACVWLLSGIERFLDMMCGPDGPEGIGKYWQSVDACGWAQDLLRHADQHGSRDTLILFSLFGDDAGVYKGEKLFMLTICPILNS